MIPPVKFSANDGRESALEKIGVFYDRIADDNLAKFVAAIQQSELTPEEMWQWCEQWRLNAVEERVRVLADVAKVLDRNNLCLLGR